MPELFLDEQNNVLGYALFGGFSQNGYIIDDIPEFVTLNFSPKKYKYVDGSFIINNIDQPTVLTEEIKSQYHNRIVELIRQKYSLDDELSILRKKLANIDNDSFAAYNQYVELCKLNAFEEFYN